MKKTKVHDVYAVGTNQGVVPAQTADGPNQDVVREESNEQIDSVNVDVDQDRSKGVCGENQTKETTNEDIGRDQ